MELAQSIRFIAGMLVLGLVMGLIAILPPATNSSQLVSAFFDAGHVPLFMVFTLVVFWLARSTVPGEGARHYLIAALLVVIAGLGTEFVQKFGLRDAGLMDFARDLLGGAVALLFVFAFRTKSRLARAAAVVAALALVAAGCAELVSVEAAYRGRDADFPTLASFDRSWERRFVHTHDAQMEIRPAPPGFGRDRAARVEFGVAEYPALAIREPGPDWSPYAALELAVWSDLPAPVTLTVRVHDAAHDETYRDRYNGPVAIRPGPNRVRVGLDQVERGPASRRLDLTRIDGIAIFADHPEEPFTLWFDDLRLVEE